MGRGFNAYGDTPGLSYEDQTRRKEARGRAVARMSALMVFVALVVGSLAISGLLDTANRNGYPLKQAIQWNWRARATNDLLDMASNLNKSIALLEPFHGNPVWYYPAPDTDFDQIRLNLIETRDTAVQVAGSAAIGSQGYQQAVQNLQETIIEINDHLSGTRGWLYYTQASLALTLMYVIVLAVLILLLIMHLDEFELPRALVAGFVGWVAVAVVVAAFYVAVP